MKPRYIGNNCRLTPSLDGFDTPPIGSAGSDGCAYTCYVVTDDDIDAQYHGLICEIRGQSR